MRYMNCEMTREKNAGVWKILTGDFWEFGGQAGSNFFDIVGRKVTRL
jgi:hypothetical protein